MSRNFGNFLGMATAGPFILTWRAAPLCFCTPAAHALSPTCIPPAHRPTPPAPHRYHTWAWLVISVPLGLAWVLLLYPYFWQRLEPMDPSYPKWIQSSAWARLRVDDDPVVLENELRALRSEGVLTAAGDARLGDKLDHRGGRLERRNTGSAAAVV